MTDMILQTAENDKWRGEWRLLKHNTESGVKTWVRIEDDGSITARDTVDPAMRAAIARQNTADRNNWHSWRQNANPFMCAMVSRMDEHVYYQLKKQAGEDRGLYDTKKMLKLLDDPDNKAIRTGGGRIAGTFLENGR